MIGALTIYANEPDAFDQEELGLLTQLADDVSYGITALRTRLEREQAQQGLDRMTRRHESILTSAWEGIFGLDLGGNYTFVNPAAAKMLGRAAPDLVGKRCHLMTSQQKAEDSLCLEEGSRIPSMLLDGVPLHLTDEVFWTIDGTAFPVEITITPIVEKGKITGSVVSFWDITERKQAEEDLKKSEERFRAIFEGANDFIFIKDLSLRYTHVNPATAKLWGVPESDMLGKTTEDFLPKEAAQTIRELDTRALSGETVEDVVTRKIRGVPNNSPRSQNTPV